MRKIPFILIGILIIMPIIYGCSYNTKTLNIPENVDAIYLVQKKGSQLCKKELQGYSEVMVVKSFDEMKRALEGGNKKVGIWIDKNAIEIVDKKWLLEEPQNSYPVLLIGFYDVMNPKPMREAFYNESIDWDSETLSEGFSFWMLNKSDDSLSSEEYIGGIDSLLTIDEMLRVTDNLIKQ